MNAFYSWSMSWFNYFISRFKSDEAKETGLESRVTLLEKWRVKMSAEFDALKAQYETEKAEIFSDLDAILAKLGTVGTNPDAAAMVALTKEMADDLAAVKAKVAPTTP